MSDAASSPRAEPAPALVDMRLIAFANRSVIAALESVGVKLLSLPAGEPIMRLVLDSKGKTIEAFYRSGVTHTLDQSRIAAAMIAYCIAARVPISRSADKSVDVTDSGVTLRFITTMKSPPRIKAA